MRKTLILEKNDMVRVSSLSDYAQMLLGKTVKSGNLAAFTGSLVFSSVLAIGFTVVLATTIARAQTVIMLDDALLGSIDPIDREQARQEALKKKNALKKAIGSKSYKADVQKPNREFKKKRGIIKTAEIETAKAKTAESSLQAVFPQPVQENTTLNSASIYGSPSLDIKGSGEILEQNTNFGRRELPKNRRIGQPPQILSQGRMRRERSASAVLDDINSGIPSSKANNRAVPVETGSRRVARDNPFVAQGFRVGSWLAFASLRQSIAYSSNLDGTADSDGGMISQSDAEFSARSNWARHQAQINASGGFTRNFGASDSNIPAGSVSSDLRLDLVNGFTARSRLGYSYTTEAVTSTTLNSNVVERPGVHTLSGSTGLERSGNRLSLSLRGSVDRTTYENAKLSGGGILSQKDRDNTFYQLIARSTYEVSGALSPFVEAKIGMRDFDLSKDRNNEDRNSSMYGGSIGVGIDLGEKLTGEISIGYNVEDFDDSNLKNLEGFTFNSSLAWSPVRETNVTLNGSTQFSGATTAGVSGSIANNLDLTVTRQISDRTQLSATAGVTITTDTDYKVDTTLWNAGTGFEYSINNHLALTGALEYDQQFSDTVSRAYNSVTIRTGIRLQR